MIKIHIRVGNFTLCGKPIDKIISKKESFLYRDSTMKFLFNSKYVSGKACSCCDNVLITKLRQRMLNI